MSPVPPLQMIFTLDDGSVVPALPRTPLMRRIVPNGITHLSLDQAAAKSGRKADDLREEWLDIMGDQVDADDFAIVAAVEE
jgi:hypothetical protein